MKTHTQAGLSLWSWNVSLVCWEGRGRKPLFVVNIWVILRFSPLFYDSVKKKQPAKSDSVCLRTHSVCNGVGVCVGNPGHFPLSCAHVWGRDVDAGSWWTKTRRRGREGRNRILWSMQTTVKHKASCHTLYTHVPSRVCFPGTRSKNRSRACKEVGDGTTEREREKDDRISQ